MAGAVSVVCAVIGGGIAGVSCAEELSRCDPTSTIHLISGTPLIKAVTNFTQVSRSLEQFDVQEKSSTYLTQACPNVTVWTTLVDVVDPTSHSLHLANGSVLNYNKLCICTGGRPKTIAQDHPRVIGIRDTESVQEFQKKLGDSRRIVVVGNGGIATELVYEVGGCEVVWAIKDQSITRTFFDEGAATFFLPHLAGGQDTAHQQSADSVSASGSDIVEVSPLKRTKYTIERHTGTGNGNGKETGMGMGVGGALGPDWHSELRMSGKAFDEKFRHIHVEYQCEVAKLLSPEEFHTSGLTTSPFPLHHDTTTDVDRSSTQSEDHTHRHPHPIPGPTSDEARDWSIYVELTNGKVYGCDLVVSATGVVPNSDVVKLKGDELSLDDGGGVVVDSEMRTSVRDVYAAGDVCTVKWRDQPQLWFQMRLWTQARQMGAYAAKCMVAHTRGEEISLDFCFELFAHVTQFFGFKVVLLGRYNAQGLGNDYEILLRCTKGQEYIKVVLQNGRMVGAILIGETDLEETFENLILNQMDLSGFGESLLDPSVDLEDYFD